MKKKTLLLAALIVISFVGISQVSYDDFDNAGIVTYPFFDGTGFDESFSNPETTGVNSSAICSRYVRNNAVQYDVMLIEPIGTAVMDDVSDYVSGSKTMSVMVRTFAAVTVQITLENSATAEPTNYPTGRHSEYTTTTSGSGVWETITFSYVNTPDATVGDTDVDRMVLLFNPDSFTDDIYLFDNLMGPEIVDPCGSVASDQSIGDNFECQRNVSYDFANGTLSTVANPLASGINTSTTVGSFKKFSSSDGAFGGALAFPFTSNDFKSVSIELYDPNAPQDFVVIFQDASNNTLVEKTFTSSSTSVWQKFSMNINSISTSTNIENVVLLLNPATTTADEIFLDNFEFSTQLSVNELGQSQSELIYPNPFVDEISIISDNLISQIEIIDISGKRIINEFVSSKKVILNTDKLEKGSYFVLVSYSNGSINSQKLIK